MEDLANMALALALTRTMLSLPYRADAAEDLERAVRVAISAASLSRHLMASSPQHPCVSTAKWMQTQPKRLHFASLVACLVKVDKHSCVPNEDINGSIAQIANVFIMRSACVLLYATVGIKKIKSVLISMWGRVDMVVIRFKEVKPS